MCGKTNQFGKKIMCSCQVYNKQKSTDTLPYDANRDFEYKESCIQKLFKKCGLRQEVRAPQNAAIQYDRRLYRIGCNLETDCYTKEYRNYNPCVIPDKEDKVKIKKQRRNKVKKEKVKKEKVKKVIEDFS